ncbi:hypothetical protein VCRA2119O147_400024 [Vibrio crassostreae]|uniref:Uncharacterized protein n=1 Tax=Vibrio crassostreae TaxID=246167 RepID=A0A822N6G7_9VIBR|nr:hypothetical protein VCRA2113O207_110014 [Vibrio crassostreae]CAK1712077.1 hypothetical protein VCRA2112O184_110015 [Vibrio crassostreae]CAK1725249.1 hypothetical protein VCRA2113O227_110140 [Vibrio crassostreae]CAK1725685.1 hypothetical protein VCRA2112O188_110143 [Vibrio crassostreae]CAK1726836.1 hypothetical protein VCRA2118O144_110140 [Vibrio crassostreae]
MTYNDYSNLPTFKLRPHEKVDLILIMFTLGTAAPFLFSENSFICLSMTNSIIVLLLIARVSR